MKTPRLPFAATALSGMLFLLSVALAIPAWAQPGNIEGTYQIQSRTLPDGTVLTPPSITGLMTYTKTHRNFNLVLRSPTGKFQSFSSVSRYSLSNDGYSETLLFSVINDQIGGKDIVYDVSGATRSVPVEAGAGRIAFRPPFDPPAFAFEGDTLTATFPDGAVDIWKQVP